MDWRRTHCLYHPQEIITNFCREKTCLMPLCPTCIRDHAQYHIQNSTKPQYFNINETLVDVQNQLYNSISNLEQDRKRNIELTKKIQGMEGLIKEKVSSAKKYVGQLMDRAFEQLEEDLQEMLVRLNQQQGLHCIKKAEKVNQKVTACLTDLYALLEGLKTDKLMGSLIVFLKDKNPQTVALHNSMLSYLDNNEGYNPKIQFSNQAKNNIIYNIGKLIKIEGKRQLDKQKDKYGESRTIFKSRGIKKEHIDQNEKHQKSYTPQKSTTYFKSNVQDYRNCCSNSYVKNSPYRQRFENITVLKPSQFINNGSHYQQLYQSQTNNKSQPELLSHRISAYRRQNDIPYKHTA